jgi:hypothetical protein
VELVGALRLLWRRRWVVCVGIGLALAAAILMAYRVDPGGSPMLESRQYEVGVASASVLVDSRSSQVVDLGGGEASGADTATLAARARLLANLIATSPLKEQIAALADVEPTSLVTRVTGDAPVANPTPVATGTTIDPGDPKVNILDLQTTESVPIITVNVQSGDERAAKLLAGSAVGELTRYLRSVAAGNRVPDARQLVVAPLGAASSATTQKGPGRALSAAAFAFVLAAWCLGILATTALAAGWRRAAAAERVMRVTDNGSQPRERTSQPLSVGPAGPSGLDLVADHLAADAPLEVAGEQR